jgi:hypothetical protein
LFQAAIDVFEQPASADATALVFHLTAIEAHAGVADGCVIVSNGTEVEAVSFMDWQAG